MTFSGPNACRGSMKEDRILPHFLHSAVLLRGQPVARGCSQRPGQAWQHPRGPRMNLHAIDDGRGLLMPMAGDSGVRYSGSRSCGAGLEGCAGVRAG